MHVPLLHRCLLRVSWVSGAWLGAGLWGDQNRAPATTLHFRVGNTIAQKNRIISDGCKCDEEKRIF